MEKNIWQTLPRPIVALAPMDGYTDSAFRRTCKSTNRALVVFTEFVSADGIYHRAKKLLQKLHYHPTEHPIVAQIFGKNVATFVSAAKKCEALGFDGIDLNMGCPAKKVVRSEHGVALRKKPALAFALVQAVASATQLPVSVKTRLGWENADDLLDFAMGVEQAGAKLITVHGRTYSQGFAEGVDFKPIYELKRRLTIPVLGNGDIASASDGLRKMRNLDGFMIGRAAVGNPWAFADRIPVHFKDKIPTIRQHAEWLVELKGEKAALLEIRKHLLAYVRGLPHATEYRSALVRVTSLQQIYDILAAICQKVL